MLPCFFLNLFLLFRTSRCRWCFTIGFALFIFREIFFYEYSSLEPTPLEKAESIDMPNVLAHGYKVHIVLFDLMTHLIDATEDLARDEALMRNDLSFQYTT